MLTLSAAVVLPTAVPTATAAAAGAADIKAIARRGTAGAIAAVFPAPSPGTPISAASGITTAASRIATGTISAVVAPTSAIAATTAVAATTLTATATTGSPGFRLVDAQGAAHQLSALQRVDGLGFRSVIRHFHKREASLAASLTFKGQRTADHFTEGCKQFRHVVLLSAEGKVADKNAHEPEIDRWADACGPLGR